MEGEREEVPENLTVRGAIRAAIDDIAERQPPEPEVPQGAEPGITKIVREAGERARDAEGKFAKDEKAKRETLTLPAKPDNQTTAIPAAQTVKPPDGRLNASAGGLGPPEHGAHHALWLAAAETTAIAPDGAVV